MGYGDIILTRFQAICLSLLTRKCKVFSYLYHPEIQMIIAMRQKEGHDPIICSCNEISRKEVEEAIREKGLKTIEEVGDETTAGTVCGGCVDEIFLLLESINGKVDL